MDISKIQLDGGVYNIKDETARNEITNLKKPSAFYKNKKVLLIGDSYGEGWTPDGNVTSWQQFFINRTGLNNTIRKYQGGAGFVNISNNKKFQTLLEEVPNDEFVTDIIVLGGYNDRPYNETQINNAMKEFQLKANEKFPNAKLYVGMVGWTKNSSTIYSLNDVLYAYRTYAPLNNFAYLSGIEYSMHKYFQSFSSDGIHPNENGQYTIAFNLIQAWLNGSTHVQFRYTNINLDYENYITNEPFQDLGCTFSDNIVEVSKQQTQTYIRLDGTITANQGYNIIDIGTIKSGYIIGSNYGICFINVPCVIGCTEGFFNVDALLRIANGKLSIIFGAANDNHNNYQTYSNISQIQLKPFHAIFNSEFC